MTDRAVLGRVRSSRKCGATGHKGCIQTDSHFAWATNSDHREELAIREFGFPPRQSWLCVLSRPASPEPCSCLAPGLVLLPDRRQPPSAGSRDRGDFTALRQTCREEDFPKVDAGVRDRRVAKARTLGLHGLERLKAGSSTTLPLPAATSFRVLSFSRSYRTPRWLECVRLASPRARRTEGLRPKFCFLGGFLDSIHTPFPLLLPGQPLRAPLHTQTLKQAGTRPQRARRSMEMAQGRQESVTWLRPRPPASPMMPGWRDRDWSRGRAVGLSTIPSINPRPCNQEEPLKVRKREIAPFYAMACQLARSISLSLPPSRAPG